jgi:hypothetical protein
MIRRFAALLHPLVPQTGVFSVLVFGALVSIAPSNSSPALAETPDTPAERQKAVARYLQVVPVRRSVEETLTQMLMQAPPQQREMYLKQAMGGMRMDVIEQAATKSMQNRFTADEINALTDFLETPAGKSAMEKMKDYTADLMPVFQSELMRAMQPAGGGYPPPGGPPNYDQPAPQPGYPGSYSYPPQGGGGYPQQPGYGNQPGGNQPYGGQPYGPQAGPNQGYGGYPPRGPQTQGQYPPPQQGGYGQGYPR